MPNECFTLHMWRKVNFSLFLITCKLWFALLSGLAFAYDLIRSLFCVTWEGVPNICSHHVAASV